MSQILLLMLGCTTYNDNGELVRHHLGYVKVITPSQIAHSASITALEINTLGLWFDHDRNNLGNGVGTGIGIGYRNDQRHYITPGSCSVIFYLQNKSDMTTVMELLKEYEINRSDICLIRN